MAGDSSHPQNVRWRVSYDSGQIPTGVYARDCTRSTGGRQSTCEASSPRLYVLNHHLVHSFYPHLEALKRIKEADKYAKQLLVGIRQG